MIAFKIRTKSSHLVKWKPIQLFYTTATIPLTHTHTHTPITCSVLVISYSETASVSCGCSLIATSLWIFVCHFSFNPQRSKYECSLSISGLKLFLEFFCDHLTNSHIQEMCCFTWKKARVNGRKRTQIGQKETDHFASYPNCLSLVSFQVRIKHIEFGLTQHLII